MRTFAIGDIHGAAAALEQCLERSGFNRQEDQLITLGDVCDGWNYVFECVAILLTIPNRIDIRGNHDEWFRFWLHAGVHPDRWSQGGNGTYRSYNRNLADADDDYGRLDPLNIPIEHHNFFRRQVDYYLDEVRRTLFVHGGFDMRRTLASNADENPRIFHWNRELWDAALSCDKDTKLNFRQPYAKLKQVTPFDEVFIGHTATTMWTTNEQRTEHGIIIPAGSPITTPMYSGGVWNLDTGAGWSGKLTIMDVDTKEYWQSDPVPTLYPKDFKNR